MKHRDDMAAIRTFGRMPTLGEMKEYYARDDVLSFLYDECQMRNITVAFRKKRWRINPTSKTHLGNIIEEMIESKIEHAYADSADPIDSVRLEKFDYLSFHFSTSINSGKKSAGFDTIFEADTQGWRRCFEDLCGVIKVLDDFGVCYRMKYSGVRSLHFMIPFEALPKQFNGESVPSQQAEIQSKITDYFRLHCGMKGAHGGKVLRLAYSLNEDNGLVSLPISSEELSSFRPWKANIYSVAIDKPWHGDISASASRKMLEFLQEIYGADAKVKEEKSREFSFGLEILPRDRSCYAAKSGESSMKEWAVQLTSDEEAHRVEAAWNIMMIPEVVPISVLQKGLADENPDVRWYLTEALQKHLDTEAIELAWKMLWDDDQFVRISAIDALVLSDTDVLQAMSNSMPGGVRVSTDSIGAINDILYAIRKISPESESESMRSLVGPIGGSIECFLLNVISGKQPFRAMCRYVRRLGEICRQYGIDESALFHDAIEAVIADSRIGSTIAHSLQEAVASGRSGEWARRYMQSVREFCKQGGVEGSAAFSEAMQLLVPRLLRGCGEGATNPYLYVSILQEIRKNEAVPLMTIREIADSLGIDSVKIPENCMTEAERESIRLVIQNGLTDITIKQKARILVLFMLCGKTRLLEPSAKVLLAMGVSEAVEEMARASRQEDILPHHLLKAVNLLKQIEPLIEEFLSGEVETLDQICDGTAMPALIEASKDENRQVRRSAVQALGKLGNPAAVLALIELLGDRGRLTTGNVVTTTMARIGQPAVPALIEALHTDGNTRRRARCALVLGKMGSPTVVSALIEALGDSHKSVRRNAAGALGTTGDPAAVPALIKALADKDGSVRASAAYALMRIGEAAREALPVLKKTLDDENPWVRVPAARALGAIGDPAAVPALIEALKDENQWVRQYAAEALANIGTPEAIGADRSNERV